MKFFLTIAIVLISITLFSQPVRRDTILLSEVTSNYPIISDIHHLQFVSNVKRWYYDQNICGQRGPFLINDTTVYRFIVNSIHSKNNNLCFWEQGGKVRLCHIRLDKNKDFWMQVKGLTLRNDLPLEELYAFFHYKGDEATYWHGPPLINLKSHFEEYYIISFDTGEPYNTQIVLTFNKHKCLKLIDIDYYDSDNFILYE